MSGTPAVSIIIALHDDGPPVAAALASCLHQSLTNIEILCVALHSSESVRAIVEGVSARDLRVRLVEGASALSPAEAQRLGAERAAAPYLLFLDSHDALAPRAAEIALDIAVSVGADIVGLGTEIVGPYGANKQGTPPRRHTGVLTGSAILATLFAKDASANGHLWGNLISADLVRGALNGLPANLQPSRADDLAISFLAAAKASTYASTSGHLYRRSARDTSRPGHMASNDEFVLELAALYSIAGIEDKLRDPRAGWGDPATVLACFDLVRLSVIADLLRSCMDSPEADVARERVAMLEDQAGRLDVIRAAATFVPDALSAISGAHAGPPERERELRHAVLATSALSTGGIQGVVVSQAKYLLQAGFEVTIALHRKAETVYAVPPEVRVVQIEGETIAERLSSWVEICESSGADVIFDHTVLYNQIWPFFALAAGSRGIATIGFLHSFALRPLRNDNRNLSFLVNHLPMLDTVVTLSATDVAFWKLRGVSHVVWLPNPPSRCSSRCPRAQSRERRRPAR